MAIYSIGDRAPALAPTAWVAPGATVLGRVVLGDGVGVWFGAVLRGDVMPIRIGARTNIQDGAVVHVTGGEAKTTVGDDVTVGHLALLHGCTVQDGVLVGMGSVILDGAVIGAESTVAAGSLVVPGTIIPPRSMAMGRPAKVVRALTDADLERSRTAARLYVGYAKDFRAKLRRVD